MKQSIMRPGYTQSLPYSHAVMTSGRLLFISGQGPARTTVQSALPTMLVEIDAILALDDD